MCQTQCAVTSGIPSGETSEEGAVTWVRHEEETWTGTIVKQRVENGHIGAYFGSQINQTCW